MLAVNSVLRAFPKGITAEILISDQLYTDRDYIDIFINLGQQDYEVI